MIVGRSHHALYDSEGTHTTPFSIVAGALGHRHPISTSGYASCHHPVLGTHILAFKCRNDVRDVFTLCFTTEDLFQQPSGVPFVPGVLTTPDPVLETIEDPFSAIQSFGVTRPQASSMMVSLATARLGP